MHRLFYTAPLVQLDNEELLQRRWYRSPATLRHDCDAIRSLRSLVARIKDVSLTTLAALGLAPPVRSALPARSFRIRPNRLSRPPSWAEPACLLGDLVLDPRWHFREYGPRNQAIRLEFAQLGRQHVLGDAGIAFRSSPKRWTLWLSSHMISSFHLPESRAMPSFMFVLAEHTAGARTALPDCRK
jgi:hypothetical protein